MDVRRATVKDWESAREIRLRSLGEAPAAFCSTYAREVDFNDHTWQDRVESAATFLAWNDGTTVGTVTGKADPHEAGSCELAAMWVDPSARRSGVAELLINSVIEWAREEGARAIALWVADDNDSARHLYEKCGFTHTGEHEAMRPGVEQLRMRKPLS